MDPGRRSGNGAAGTSGLLEVSSAGGDRFLATLVLATTSLAGPHAATGADIVQELELLGIARHPLTPRST